MDYVVIDGKAYDVLVEKISENFNILYSDKTGRSTSVGARMILDPLGTFYGHKITFRRRRGKEAEFDALWTFVSVPRYNGIRIKAADNQSTIEYEAYISQGERTVKRIDAEKGIIYWDAFELNIVPMEAQVLPSD